MKVLFFTDVHGDVKTAKKLVEKSRKADLAVCAGDLSRLGEGFGEVISELKKMKKLLLIPGNNETPEFVNEATEEYDNILIIEDDVYQDLEIRFLGIGGGSISPFNTPYELTDEEFRNKLDKYGDNITVLVSHTPPKNTKLDKTRNGLHIGSFAIGEWIKKNQPRLCCCGHVHECQGQEEMIGNTLCFNPGPEGVIKEL
ncbi:MAG: metallophosphoesterase family protein [Nanoarchaeota archaeon]|nr:metallophosphoesterase family protein [Nanoarchaeota archaeon]